MSHGISEKDTAWFYRQPAWHGLGEVATKRPKTARQWLKQAGLDWRVRLDPVLTLPNVAIAANGPAKGTAARAGEYAIDGFRAVVREDTGDVLGMVTPQYEPFQNHEVFDFLEALLGEVIPETAFSLHGGRQIGALSRIPEHIEVGGDEVRTFIYNRTRHDGGGALWTWPTNVRVVCANTDRLAIQEAGGQDSPTIHKIQHRGNRSVQVAEARAALQLTVDYRKQFKKVGDKLARQKITEKQLGRVLEQLYPSGTTDRKATTSAAARGAVMELFLHGPTVGNAPGSRWCAYNAIVEHHQHDRPVRTKDARVSAERKFVRAIEDPDGFSAMAHKLVATA